MKHLALGGAILTGISALGGLSQAQVEVGRGVDAPVGAAAAAVAAPAASLPAVQTMTAAPAPAASLSAAPAPASVTAAPPPGRPPEEGSRAKLKCEENWGGGPGDEGCPVGDNGRREIRVFETE